MKIYDDQLPGYILVLKLLIILVPVVTIWVIYRAKKKRKITTKQIYYLILIALITAVIMGYLVPTFIIPNVIRPFFYSHLQ